MTGKRLALFALISVVGFGLLAWAYPRTSQAPRLRYSLDREPTIHRAKDVARRLGTDVTGWSVSMGVTDTGTSVRYLRERTPSPEMRPFVQPLYAYVLFIEPTGAHQLMVRFSMEGRPIGAWRRGFTNDESAPTTSLDRARATVRAVLDEATATAVLGHAPVVTRVTDDEERIVFPFRTSEDGIVTVGIDIYLRKGVVARLVGDPTFTQAFQDQVSDRLRASNVLRASQGLLLAGLWIAAAVFLCSRLVRWHVDYRSAAGLAALLLVLVVVPAPFGPVDRVRVETAMNSRRSNITIQASRTGAARPLDVRLQEAFAAFNPFSLGVLPYWIVGYAVARRGEIRRWRAARELFSGRVLSRSVGAAVAIGLPLAGVFAAIPHVIALSGIVPNAALGVDIAPALFGSRAPHWFALAAVRAIPLLAVFGFFCPVIERYVRHRIAARAIVLGMATWWLATGATFPTSVPAALLTGVLSASFAYAVYTKLDLLTLLVAGAGAPLVLQAAALISQPSSDLRSAGSRLCIGLAGATIVGLVVAWKGREVDLAMDAAPIVDLEATASERDRLKAEFLLAGRVQQQMLPMVPPEIDGFGLAASCQPTREVGGDLYELTPLAANRYVIAVADVSGKGMSASLYMTMTKGLVGAAIERVTEPDQIAAIVNEHLYQACARKVFVTMALGVLDTRARTFRYARAGHNPPIWRRTARRETRMLRARGLGLGLAGPAMFNARTVAETIHLEPTDVVVLYSDGIVEAMNEAREEYGEPRLIGVIERTDGLDAGAVKDAILEDVRAFVGAALPHDDMTLVVVKAPPA